MHTKHLKKRAASRARVAKALAFAEASFRDVSVGAVHTTSAEYLAFHAAFMALARAYHESTR